MHICRSKYSCMHIHCEAIDTLLVCGVQRYDLHLQRVLVAFTRVGMESAALFRIDKHCL